MKILAIYPYGDKIFKTSSGKVLPNFSCIPIGFASVITQIKKSGYKIDLAVLINDRTIEENINKIFSKCEYDAVFLTCVSQYSVLTGKIAGFIKKYNPSVKILIGGAHATLFADSLIKSKKYDAVCIGEGFKTVSLYADYLAGCRKASDLDGFYIKEKNKILKNHVAAFCDFAEFPVIDRKIWEPYVDDSNVHSVLISRGCVHRCSFCVNHVFKSKNTGQYVSCRNIDDILKEIKLITKNYPDTKNIILESETLTANLKFTYKLLETLKEYNNSIKNKLSFRINISFNNGVKKDIFNFIKKLKQANVTCVNIGLESGSVRIRSEILNRPDYSNDDFIEFCDVIKNAGLSLILCVMFAIPTETKEEVKETVDIIKKIDPYCVNSAFFCIYPGTDISKLTRKNKIYASANAKMKNIFIKALKEISDNFGIHRKRLRVKIISELAAKQK